MTPIIEAWFDGCCEPRNPGGHGSSGIVIKRDNEALCAIGGYVGVGPEISNNVCEYAGVVAILKWLIRHENTLDVVIRGDSRLVVNQLNGSWNANGGLYFSWYEKARNLLKDAPFKVRFEWIPRERNEECDALSKKVLLDKGVKFRIQPEKGGAK